MTVDDAEKVMIEEATRLCNRANRWSLYIRQTNSRFLDRPYPKDPTEPKSSEESWYVSITDRHPMVDSDLATVHANGPTLELAVLHLIGQVTAMAEHKRRVRQFNAEQKKVR